MSAELNRQSNIDRFLGFQQLYDDHRPEAPVKLTELLIAYLGKKPGLVVDVGCGTGLSTFVWRHAAERVIGVEPNPDMLSKAREKLKEAERSLDKAKEKPAEPRRMDKNALPDGSDGSLQEADISFETGYSNRLELADGAADIITCSQSFHWMEPASTLQECARVLADGGVFAVYDCDWPPVLGWRAEQAYLALIKLSEQLLKQWVRSEEAAVKRDKEQHLAVIRESGLFRYSRELVFHHEEAFNAERALGLALSQGGIQAVLKLGQGSALEQAIGRFKDRLDDYYAGASRQTLLSYRLRLGVK